VRRGSAAITLAAAALCAAAPAAADGWARALFCQVNPAPDDAPHLAVTPAALAEFRAFGRGRVVEGREGRHYVAFTFDDGPKATTTPQVLDALDAYDVPAAFFVVATRYLGSGVHSQRNAAVLEDTIARGHLVANHTWRHRNLAQLSQDEVRAEIDRGAAALAEYLGHMSYLFRPPYGALSERAREHLAQEGYTIVMWGIDSNDFRIEDDQTLRRRTVARILEREGGVVLMHDTKVNTARQIGGILDDLEAANCRRLAAGEPPIIPVSLHYFIRDEHGGRRPIPPEVAARTERYRAALPARCEARGARIDKGRRSH
jgi:peptidoglycan/xylan/chitin deacetylase (PgdA/CDA1 family)